MSRQLGCHDLNPSPRQLTKPSLQPSSLPNGSPNGFFKHKLIHITALIKTLNWPPIILKRKPKPLTMAHKALCEMTSLTSSPTSLLLANPAPDALDFFPLEDKLFSAFPLTSPLLDFPSSPLTVSRQMLSFSASRSLASLRNISKLATLPPWSCYIHPVLWSPLH